MFTTLVIIVHVIVSVIMVLIILLQSGKGADIGAVFGGGSSQTVFGSSGATPFLSKITIGAAVTFMVTSIVLSYFSGKAIPVERSIMQSQPVKEAPITPGAAPTPEAPAKPGEGSAVPAGPEAPTGPAPASEASPAATPAPPGEAPVSATERPEAPSGGSGEPAAPKSAPETAQ